VSKYRRTPDESGATATRSVQSQPAQQRPVPGATTITGQMFPSGRSVQRKAADSHAPGVIGAPATSSWELTTSADMDAAHRGARTTAEGDAVQASSVTQAQGATGARVFDHLASAPSTASSGVPATRGLRAAGAAGSGGTARAGQAAGSIGTSSSPAVQASPAHLGAAARPEPESKEPAISCAAALLAALPPDQPVGDAQRVFDTEEHEVTSVIAEQMTYPDIKAFHAIRRAHPQHPLARRFQRFGDARRGRLLGILAGSSGESVGENAGYQGYQGLQGLSRASSLRSGPSVPLDSPCSPWLWGIHGQEGGAPFLAARKRAEGSRSVPRSRVAGKGCERQEPT
jgi:hypothetical protein